MWSDLAGVYCEIREDRRVPKPSDVSIQSTGLYFLEVKTRVPYKFGQQVLEEITCARARVTVRTMDGKSVDGWGETPLSVGWVWPTTALGYSHREDRLKAFCCRLAGAFGEFDTSGHPLEIGHAFQEKRLRAMLAEEAEEYPDEEAMPYLAGLVCLSAFDLALYDAFGCANPISVFDGISSEYMNADLSAYLVPDAEAVDFA